MIRRRRLPKALKHTFVVLQTDSWDFEHAVQLILRLVDVDDLVVLFLLKPI